jgi:trehalose-6-phosphate synthase
VENYYKQNFAMIQHHSWSLSELDNMLPWEREIYSGLLMKHLEAEKAEHDKQQRKMKG